MDLDKLLKLYKARDLILQDKEELENTLSLVITVKEKEYRDYFDKNSAWYTDVILGSSTHYIVNPKTNEREYRDAFIERKLSEDTKILNLEKRISYRENFLKKIDDKIDIELKYEVCD